MVLFSIAPNGPNWMDSEVNTELDNGPLKAAQNELVGKTKTINNGRMVSEVRCLRLRMTGAVVIVIGDRVSASASDVR